MMATKKKVKNREELTKAIDKVLGDLPMDVDALQLLLAELRALEPKKVKK